MRVQSSLGKGGLWNKGVDLYYLKWSVTKEYYSSGLDAKPEVKANNRAK